LISKKLAGFSKSLGKLVEFTIEKKPKKNFQFSGSKITKICWNYFHWLTTMIGPGGELNSL
jgi:hypothetical protein